MKFDLKTRLILVSTKPTPHARHVVCEPHRIRISPDPVDVTIDNSQVSGPHQDNNTRSTMNYAVTGNLHIVFIQAFRDFRQITFAKCMKKYL